MHFHSLRRVYRREAILLATKDQLSTPQARLDLLYAPTSDKVIESSLPLRKNCTFSLIKSFHRITELHNRRHTYENSGKDQFARISCDLGRNYRIIKIC